MNASLLAVHAEGIAERVGDVVFTCSGATPGAQLAPTFYVGLTGVSVTNPTDSLGATDVVLSVNLGGGYNTASTSVTITGTSAVVAQGVPVTIPPSGSFSVRFQNIRAAMNQLAPVQGGPTVVNASGVVGGGFVLQSLPIAVAFPNASLLTSFLNNGVPCSGSPVPASNDLPALFANGTSVSVLRVTEGFVNAFSRRDPVSKNGTRIVVSISGYASGARVFVPDGIVGNSGSIPTGANAFGFSNQSGVYIPGGNSLLLARVNGADSNGAGGTPVFGIPSSSQTFSSASEVTLTNGAGTVTYEVVDGNDGIREDAHIPVFVSIPQSPCTGAVPGNSVSAKIGPISTVVTSNPDAPEPRFAATVPGNDCTVLGDCGASYYPQLSVDTTPIVVSGASLGPAQNGYVRISNLGPGYLSYKISVTYPAGAAATGWLTPNTSTGSNSMTVQLTLDPGKLAKGTYTATVVVDAGQYGVKQVPITFNVGDPGVTIQSLVSAATFTAGAPLAPGSVAALFGLNLNGKFLAGVTFDGIPATVFGVYSVAGGQQQINLQVPPALANATSNVTVTVDGNQSNTFPVKLSPNVPGIFNPGILNQDFSVNGTNAPIQPGKYVYVYLTGLAIPLTGPVTVKIGSVDQLVPQYAGPAPSLTGLEQVNVQVPNQLAFTGNTTTLTICVPRAGAAAPVCSPPATLYISQ